MKKLRKKFYVTNREDSSSFLKPDINTLSDYNIKRILKIKIDKLDNCLKILILKKVLLKVDVQGYELSALKGALRSLKKIDYIIIEISYENIYKNQASKNKLINFLKKKFKILKVSNISKKEARFFKLIIYLKKINYKDFF